MSNMQPTFAQQMTGKGRGAVASILLQGSKAHDIVRQSFISITKADPLALNQIYFGEWCWKDYQEDLVVTRTGDSCYEIHCHGGDLATQAILASLVAQGVQVCTAANLRHMLPPVDRFSAEAIAQLPSASTVRVAAILLDQSRGAMVNHLRKVGELLSSNKLEQAKEIILQILKYESLGPCLIDSFVVVLLGTANSGKSSLVNAILGFDRAIVFDKPGTTRDLLTTITVIDGWPITLIDTAGIRETDDRVESVGIRKAQERVKLANLVLRIHDLSDTPDGSRSSMLDNWQTNAPCLQVGTKADLLSTTFDNVDVATSAVTGQLLDELCDAIVEQLVPEPPPSGQAVPISDWQRTSLTDILAQINEGDALAANALIAELVSS